MFWKFGFATSSSIDTILDKPNVSLEEILDEDNLLSECKSQNTKLISFLQQPRILKRLLQHVVGTADNGTPQGPEWEEKVQFRYPYIASEVLACDIWAIAEGLLAEPKELLEPFWDAVLTWDPDPNATPTPHHSHPLFQSSFKLPAHLEAETQEADRPMPSPGRQVDGPGKSVLAGYWAKVNGFLLDKKPVEMLDFIKSLPSIVERFAAHVETPAVIDLLYRIIQCEESSPSVGIVDWLADRDLVVLLIELLSPCHSPDVHINASELLKAIIALSAPSPASLTQNVDPTATGLDGARSAATGVVTNRIVRDLAGEEVVKRMVAFMLDSKDSSDAAADAEKQDVGEDAGHKAAPSEEEAPKPWNPRDSPASELNQLPHHEHQELINGTKHEPEHEPEKASTKPRAPEVDPSEETRSSSLVTCISIFIELIRKNNSDYFEQHLFHTLRSHLLQRQQEISEQRLSRMASKVHGSEDDDDPTSPENNEEEDEMEGMEEAMAEISEKLGIVHLGPMLQIISERLPDFQKILMKSLPESARIDTSIGTITPLSFERYRITELYAELLHCSNMALLNRPPGSGPQYSAKGTLLGGIDGLQVLAKALSGGEEGGDDSMQEADSGDEEGRGEKAAEDDDVDSEVKRRSRHAREVSTAGANGSSDYDISSVDVSISSSNLPTSASDVTIGHPEPTKTVDAVVENVEKLDLQDDQQAKLELVGDEDSDATLFVGDLLKKRFQSCRVVPSILQLFFEYPWNNFLHNVVYDILQQFFNGRMNAGHNEKLTLSVFTDGELCNRIVAGQEANQKSAAGPRRIRLGYMGHLNLIAEETAKLLERYPQEIASKVEHTIPQPQWNNLLQHLQLTRQKESAPLAGGRPAMSMSLGGSGLGGYGASAEGEENTFASYLSSQIGPQSDDDDDSDEDAGWVGSRGNREASGNSEGFDDAFRPIGQTGGDNDQFEDDWGPFAGSSDPAAPQPASDNPFEQNLTSADWAAEWHKQVETDSALQPDAGTAPASPSDNDDPFGEFASAPVPLAAMTADRARRRSSASSGSDHAAAQAVDKDAPLGPGVDASKTETTEDGRLVRTIDDGLGGKIQVAVPLDDVALAMVSEGASPTTAAAAAPAESSDTPSSS